MVTIGRNIQLRLLHIIPAIQCDDPYIENSYYNRRSFRTGLSLLNNEQGIFWMKKEYSIFFNGIVSFCTQNRSK